MAATTRTSPRIGIEPREVDLTPIRSRSLTLSDRAEMDAFFRAQRAKNDGDPVVLGLRNQLDLTKERPAVAKKHSATLPGVVGVGYISRSIVSPAGRVRSISAARYAGQVAAKPTSVRAAAAKKAAPAPKATSAAAKAAGQPKRKKK